MLHNLQENYVFFRFKICGCAQIARLATSCRVIWSFEQLAVCTGAISSVWVRWYSTNLSWIMTSQCSLSLRIIHLHCSLLKAISSPGSFRGPRHPLQMISYIKTHCTLRQHLYSSQLCASSVNGEGRPIMAFLSWPPSRLLAVCHNLWSTELWRDAVLGLSHPNYPMLNDIKLPLCYKSTAEHNSFVYCLSIFCPFLALSPSPNLSRVKMCKSAFQSNWAPKILCNQPFAFCSWGSLQDGLGATFLRKSLNFYLPPGK